MKKRVLFGFGMILLTAILAFVFQLSYFGGITGYIVYSESDKINFEVLESFEENNEVEVIIGVNGEGDVEDIKENDIVTELSSGDIVANVNRKALRNILRDEDVEYVEPVRIFNANLNDAINIVNVSLVWPLTVSGINLTGSGKAVCVIDTGVNYSHSDLIGKNLTSCNLNCIDQICVEDCNQTDLNGHGTHVAGIVAASGGILGIGKDVNIIGLKVFPGNSSTGATTAGIKNAIDWCVDNSTIYNISVISMSLGTTNVYSGYCDSQFPSFRDSIANAFAKNISVVVSTGNEGSGVLRNITAIASPACIQNATPVSATNDDDSIASYGHYSSIVELFAPGTNINSSCIEGGYCRKSGTSMAAPMVSGGIAIINQFLDLSGQTKTPLEIDSVLNSSGKGITDGNLNFSRVDFYQAILLLDNIDPEVYLISPNDGRANFNQNWTFSCNMSDWQLYNNTFYLWNSSGDMINQTSVDISGEFNESNFSIYDLSLGSYEWNCLVYDDVGNLGFASSNYSFVIGGVSVLLVSPEDNNYTSETNASFNCDVQSEPSAELVNVSFYLWNSSGNLTFNYSFNFSNGVFNYSYEVNYSFVYEDNYEWNCFTINNASNSSFYLKNYTIGYDVSAPEEINLVSPSDGSSYSSNSQEISFYFNISDNSPADCDLLINNESNFSDQNVLVSDSSNQNFSETFTPGSYSWSINCTDLAGNTNISDEWSFVVNSVEVGVSSGGGGSGSSSGGGAVPSSSSANEEDDAEYVADSEENDEDLESEVSLSPGRDGIVGESIGDVLASIVGIVIGIYALIIVIIVIFIYLGPERKRAEKLKNKNGKKRTKKI